MGAKLHGKVALITGAGSGIGRAAALTFAREGASVVVSDIDDAGGLQTVHLIQELSGQGLYVRANVASAEDVEALVAEAVDRFGHLDYAFNNAGITGEMGTIVDCTEKNWDHMIDVHLKGVWLCLKYEIQSMVSQNKGAIVNASSVGGIAGFTGNAAYVAAKHGIIGLTKAAALEYAAFGIRVNAVCPGYIRTPMVERLIEIGFETEEMIVDRHPLGRIGTPADVAEAVLWLCSDESSFITGHALAVDGGYLAR